MKIDQSLNLVSIVERDVFPLYVYVTPFPYETVENYYPILARAFSQFYQDVGQIGAPRVAAMILRKLLKGMQLPDDGSPTLVDEISRMSQVVAWDGSAWKQYPLASAIDRGVITQDEWRDIEGEVCFFIVGSAMQKRSLIPSLVGGVLSMYSAQLTSLSCMEYRASLPTSKAIELQEVTIEEEVPPVPNQPMKGRVRIPS